MKKLMVLGICLGFLTVFTAPVVRAHPHCGKVWVEGHHDRHGRWIKPHWKKQHWVNGHHNHHGEWVPGHCR